jgi:hypothetical protein
VTPSTLCMFWTFAISLALALDVDVVDGATVFAY